MMIELRPVTQSDMAQCAAILNDWIDETPWMPRELAHDEIERIYDKALANGREGFVAWDDGVCGYTLFVRAEQRLAVLYVKRGSRQQQLGTRLLSAVKESLPQRIELTCYEPNARAQQFYRRHGFREVGRVEPEKENGVAELKFVWTGHD